MFDPIMPHLPEDHLRSQEEIAQLHDLLGRIVNDDISLPLAPGQLEVLTITLGVLCWTLRHPAGERLDSIMADIKRLMREVGYGDDGSRPDPGSSNPRWN